MCATIREAQDESLRLLKATSAQLEEAQRTISRQQADSLTAQGRLQIVERALADACAAGRAVASRAEEAERTAVRLQADLESTQERLQAAERALADLATATARVVTVPSQDAADIRATEALRERATAAVADVQATAEIVQETAVASGSR